MRIRTFSLKAHKIPEIVMGTLALGNLIVRFGLDCVNYIRKFNGILDEKHRNIVSNKVPNSLLSVKLDSKASYITYSILPRHVSFSVHR